MVQSIREAGDVGHPVALQENTSLENAFATLTKEMVSELLKRNANLPPTEVVRITTMSGCSPVKSKFMTTQETLQNVEKALNEIRPFLESDGGNIKLLSIEDTVVKVQLEGACIGCSVNQMTLKNGVEATIKKYVPHIEQVINID